MKNSSGLDPAEAKRIRAERNRESAKRSRELAKERNNQLEMQLRELTGENEELKANVEKLRTEYLEVQEQVDLSGLSDLQDHSRNLLRQSPNMAEFLAK
mmetsp:Transcript_43558/g.106932  ORF Transcript_43558/g.106932 Transcript_43558/m.106932 type:complete len:99 (+) Transcript_43558:181-477(+)